MIEIVLKFMTCESVWKIWNDRNLEYSCTTVREDETRRGVHIADESFTAKIRLLEPYECHYRDDLERFLNWYYD